MHKNESEFAGQEVVLKQGIGAAMIVGNLGGATIRIEDWWDRVAGKSWMVCDGNPACLAYAVRTGLSHSAPTDDEVLYGKVGSFGALMHVSEISYS